MTARFADFRTTYAGARFHFIRHLVEMTVAMWIGMPLGRVIFAAVFGSASNDAVRQHDIAWTLLMAVAMTVPMVAVMLYRHHSRRSAGEMAAAMIAPALPFVALKIGHVITGPVAGAYMCVSMFAMIALIAYRRREYQRAAAAFELSRLMGTSIAMIDRHYGHLARDSEDSIRARLDARSNRSGVFLASDGER